MVEPDENTTFENRSTYGVSNRLASLHFVLLDTTVSSNNIYLPVDVITTMIAAIQLTDASTAANAVVCVMSVGRGVSSRSSSNS